MQALRAYLLILGLMLAAAPVSADQTDMRLDELFASLQQAPGPLAAAPIERQIWTIWLETTDQDIAALMTAGIKQMMVRRDYAAALAVFDEIVAAAPGFAEAWNKRATVHYLIGNLDRSLADIARTLELEPRHFGALSGRGLVYVKLEDLGRALVAFEDALAVNPQMPGPRANAKAIRKVLKSREI